MKVRSAGLVTNTENHVRNLVAAGTLATATLGSVLGIAPRATAQQAPPEEPTSWETSPGPADETHTDTPAADPTSTTAGQSCGLFARWDRKATAVFGPVNIDVFKGGYRPGVCENDSVLTEIYANSPTCEKYAWGVLYGRKTDYKTTPSSRPNSSNAWGDFRCGYQLGGKIDVGPVETTVSVSKMMVLPFAYRMNGKGARGDRLAWYYTNF